MPRASRLKLEPALGIAGALLLPACVILMLRGVKPFVTHAYEISWWSLIAALDGVVWWRTRRSPLSESPFRFLLLSLWSVALWFFFELVNLRLKNWHYIYVGADQAERWTGSFLAFATVIPGVVLLGEALAALGVFRSDPSPRAPRRIPRFLPGAMALLGVAFLVLPLIWPRSLYPLVWGGLILVLDPLNRRWGGGSFLGEWERGSVRTLWLYLAAGLLAGLFWEALNYGARVKWIYTVPFFEELKLFEMPLLGFLGFPPFALSCRAAAETLVVLGLVPGPGAGPAPSGSTASRRLPLLGIALLASGLAAAAALPAMDRHTFASLYPLVADLPDLDPSLRAELRARGIEDLFELREELSRRGESGTPLARRVELVLHAGIGIEKAVALEGLGVTSVADLARADPGDLARKLSALDLRHRPSPAEVRLWVRRARVSRGSGN